MPRLPKLSRSLSIHEAAITSSPILDFLAPAVLYTKAPSRQDRDGLNRRRNHSLSESRSLEELFYVGLFQASLCETHQKRCAARHRLHLHTDSRNEQYLRSRTGISRSLKSLVEVRGDLDQYGTANECAIRRNGLHGNNAVLATSAISLISQPHPHRKLDPKRTLSRSYYTRSVDFESKQRRFAEGSHLPSNFFDDISAFTQDTTIRPRKVPQQRDSHPSQTERKATADQGSSSRRLPRSREIPPEVAPNVIEQLKLLSSVRELEEKLENAKKNLAESMTTKSLNKTGSDTVQPTQNQTPVVLTKEDYMNLVDLYYYSHNNRFSPESTDDSPTPLLLDDYSFTLSADFSAGVNATETVNEDENYESPLKQIEEMLKQRQLREIAVMQVFVDLLLDDRSSNRALYEAYQELPDPGVDYLPKGIVRLFLQRMSTPWTVSEKSMLRYLSLIDDMQRAKIPITVAEWSSAVYLAGRAFSKITTKEVDTSFKLWQIMEQEAGVQASHVTFNILFDIAVRSGKFALGESVLREMHSRNLRLNRLGRVSLMYYHGLRKDGDGVRKAYRDFVEAGEIVDTLVLNCVIASLLNAQEPQAAEQVYARMKNMQSHLRKGVDRDANNSLYERYPDPGINTIDKEMASNHLGRVLEAAPRLQQILPEHHQQLQASMPLTPDHITFRALIAYHATTSGDLDRLTVLLKDMTEFFDLPLQTITFQLLFKGFAIHSPMEGPTSIWSVKRLEMCWNACRSAIKKSESVRTVPAASNAVSRLGATIGSFDDDSAPIEIMLPSITQINGLPEGVSVENLSPPLSRPSPQRLSEWSEFVLDLAAFPRERLKRLERFHSTMFDEENVVQPHEQPGPHTFRDPFFQSVAYTAPEPQLDTEEGEYELPNPSESGLLHEAAAKTGSKRNSSIDKKASQGIEGIEGAPHQVWATRSLICWLIRAYARTTKSRSKVEEIWGQIRKVFKPHDNMERESVLRVLRRCLRDCDREGNG